MQGRQTGKRWVKVGEWRQQPRKVTKSIPMPISIPCQCQCQRQRQRQCPVCCAARRVLCCAPQHQRYAAMDGICCCLLTSAAPSSTSFAHVLPSLLPAPLARRATGPRDPRPSPKLPVGRSLGPPSQICGLHSVRRSRAPSLPVWSISIQVMSGKNSSTSIRSGLVLSTLALRTRPLLLVLSLT